MFFTCLISVALARFLDLQSVMNPAESRANALMFYVPDYQKVIVLGGRNDFFRVFDDMWQFNPQTLAWDEIIPVSVEKPGKLSGACGAYFSSSRSIFVYGGYRFSQITSSLWRFRLEFNTVNFI